MNTSNEIDNMYVSEDNQKKILSDVYEPKTSNSKTIAQEILSEILTNVLDASNELDEPRPNWYKVTLHSNNIKELQHKLHLL